MGITDEEFKAQLNKIVGKVPALEYATTVRVFRSLHIYQPELPMPEISITNVGSISLFWKKGTGDTLETFLVEILRDGEVEWLYENQDRLKWFSVCRWEDSVPLPGTNYIKRF
jgi:hypothetical protein